MANNNIISKQEITTHIDENGNETITVKETTTNFQKNKEPDYVKIYTDMWCSFNKVPPVYRELFLQLVTRMSYCNAGDLKNSQLVNTGKPWSDDIMNALGWQKAMYQRGLKALCDCGAIKKINRGVYQINPNYASRGEWKYNPKLQRGGVEDLIATFNFRDKTVDTQIIWADDGKDNDMNTQYRNGLNVSAKQDTVLKSTQISLNDDEELNKLFDNPALEEIKEAE